MIKNALKVHYANMNPDNNHMTSYFDKLIQVPIQIPRLGENEIRSYIFLLLCELLVREKKINENDFYKARDIILEKLKKGFFAVFEKKVLIESFGTKTQDITNSAEIAERLSGIMIKAKEISGNPRLIKRFLNELYLRERIASASGISVCQRRSNQNTFVRTLRR